PSFFPPMNVEILEHRKWPSCRIGGRAGVSGGHGFGLPNRVRDVMRSGKSSAASKRRTDLRNELWPQEPAWIADEEVGFFRAPRTLPLLLTLISSKKISGKKNAATVYLDLWARNWGEGIIEIIDEGDHAFA